MIETGKVLQQRYRIDRQIGQGGMGAVYIATDERFGSVVAIKETLLMDDSYRKAIEREARLLNSLKHTALPRVSDHFLEENGQFLVMEYVPGEDLGVMMEGGSGPFPVADVLVWADQLLEALDFLHNQAIPVIHRDIKPQNLKLNARGQIMLLDFGLAKGNPTDAGGHHTAAKSIFGYSKNYASLEQIQGTGTDPRSDLYSLAATLYHLLTGRPPDDALTRAMAVLSQLADPLSPADVVRSEVPRGVAAILDQAMDLNASMRPGSAAEMRSMLREHEKHATAMVTRAYRNAPVDPDLLSQKTRILHSDTQQEGGKLTDVKTAILPAYASQETSVRSAAPSKRYGTRAAAVVGGLAIAAGAVAGAYYYDPAVFGVTSEAPENAPVVAAPAANSEPPVNADPADAESALANSEPVENEPEAATAAGRTRSAGSAKTAKQAPGKGRSDQLNADDENITIGNVRIRDGVIETPEVYIDEDGIRRKMPKMQIPQIPLMTEEQLQKLTPEKRRKLRLLMEQQHRRPAPAPSPEEP